MPLYLVSFSIDLFSASFSIDLFSNNLFSAQVLKYPKLQAMIPPIGYPWGSRHGLLFVWTPFFSPDEPMSFGTLITCFDLTGLGGLGVLLVGGESQM